MTKVLVRAPQEVGYQRRTTLLMHHETNRQRQILVLSLGCAFATASLAILSFFGAPLHIQALAKTEGLQYMACATTMATAKNTQNLKCW